MRKITSTKATPLCRSGSDRDRDAEQRVTARPLQGAGGGVNECSTSRAFELFSLPNGMACAVALRKYCWTLVCFRRNAATLLSACGCCRGAAVVRPSPPAQSSSPSVSASSATHTQKQIHVAAAVIYGQYDCMYFIAWQALRVTRPGVVSSQPEVRQSHTECDECITTLASRCIYHT